MKTAKIVSLLLVALLAGGPMSQAALIHISKSFSQPFTALQTAGVDNYEFQITTPILIDKCLEYTGNGTGVGYNRNLDSAGKSVVIFEDSSTYVIADDQTAETTGGWEADPTARVFLSKWNLYPPGTDGTSGIIIKAAVNQSPVIDCSNVPAGAYGNKATFWWVNSVPGQTLTFQGISIVQTSGDLTYGNGIMGVYGDSVTQGGDMPYFKDCKFTLSSALFIVWPTASHITFGTGVEYDHCAFRFLAGGQGYFGYTYSAATPGTMNFKNCTFIGNDTQRWGAAGYDSTYQADFDHCILYKVDTFTAGTSHAYQYCLDWPEAGAAGKIAGTGNITADPLFVDEANSFAIRESSPATNATMDPADNIGYDLTTVPVELSSFEIH